MKDQLQIIESFTHSLTNTKTVSEVCWEITKNVIARLGFEDCVVYLHDVEQDVLVQMAAHGPKNPIDLDIYHPITIRPGQGIVGAVFETGVAEIVNDTRLDDRYIVDDAMRLSELAVPIIHQGLPIGVIDSEHSSSHFFTQEHLLLLNTLASIASNKIVKTKAFLSLEEAHRILEEKNRQEKVRNLELRKINQQLDDIIYSLSHDFRSPILAAIGIIDWLSQHPDQLELFLPKMKYSLHQLDEILVNIHHFSQNKRRPVEHKPLDLFALIRDIYQQLPHEGKERVRFQMDGDSPASVSSDHYRLSLLIRELLNNALKFGLPETEMLDIHVYIELTETLCQIQVSDNGPGIPEFVIEKLGQLFQRGSSLIKGAGLGIFLCMEMAEALGGQIHWSRPDAGGTLVSLRLPIS